MRHAPTPPTWRRLAGPLATAALLASTACDERPPEPVPDGLGPARPGSSPTTASSAARSPHGGMGTAPQQAPRPSGGVLWDKPAAWEEVSHTSAMRLATYRIPKVEGDTDDAEVSVIPAGGSVDANIDRWQGQFDLAEGKEPTRTKKTVNGLEVTLVEMHGTFKGGNMPGQPAGEAKTGWTMLAAIVPSGEGNHTFFKVTGPQKTIDAARSDFDVLVGSIRSK